MSRRVKRCASSILLVPGAGEPAAVRHVRPRRGRPGLRGLLPPGGRAGWAGRGGGGGGGGGALQGGLPGDVYPTTKRWHAKQKKSGSSVGTWYVTLEKIFKWVALEEESLGLERSFKWVAVRPKVGNL